MLVQRSSNRTTKQTKQTKQTNNHLLLLKGKTMSSTNDSLNNSTNKNNSNSTISLNKLEQSTAFALIMTNKALIKSMPTSSLVTISTLQGLSQKLDVLPITDEESCNLAGLLMNMIENNPDVPLEIADSISSLLTKLVFHSWLDEECREQDAISLIQMANNCLSSNAPSSIKDAYKSIKQKALELYPSLAS